MKKSATARCTVAAGLGIAMALVILPHAAVPAGSESVWVERVMLNSPDGLSDFGHAVAISGDTAVIGALGRTSGSAHVFTRKYSTWTRQAKLTASDGAMTDRYGHPVAISGDTVVVGASGDDDLGSGSGSAYVFARNGYTWTRQAKLTASDGAAGDGFGWSVAISGDTVLIGAAGSDPAGSAYVFTRSGTDWTEQTKLTSSDGVEGDRFGSSVAISGDTSIIGAYADGDGAWGEPGYRTGSAYVFARTGSAWTQQAKLTASDAAAFDWFGWSVAIREDEAVIGAPVDAEFSSGPGSAYVYTRSGSTWTQQAKLTASDGESGDEFGWSVALTENAALIGAKRDDVGGLGAYTGSAYVFVGSGSEWNGETKLTASDAARGAQFGRSVAISGTTALIGAPTFESAYLFVDSSGDAETPKWPEGSSLRASDVGVDGLTLSWPAATDDVGINGYRVFQDAVLTAVVSGSTLSLDITGLAPATPHRFEVEAGDAVEHWSTDGPSVTVTTATDFVDTEGNVFEDDITWLAVHGITKGCNPPYNDKYCPNTYVTRGQMAAFLVRALDLTDRLPDPFVDDDDSIFEADIEKLAKAGITKGCNPPHNTRFCPDHKVTRGQMAAFLSRALGYVDDGGGDWFIDDDDSIFEHDIDCLATAGVTKGCDPPANDKFCPTSYVTRGQMAAFLHRALGSGPGPGADPGDAAVGASLFEGTCVACHGSDAKGIAGLGKDLTSNVWIQSHNHDELVDLLRGGRPASHPDNTTGVDMPPRGGNPTLTDDDLDDIAAYLRTLQP